MASESTLRNNVVSWCEKYLGIKEGSTEHKEIINIFNNSGLCSRYKMTVNDAWCATFVSAAFIALGLTSKCFPCVECACSNMITLAKKAGMWVEDDAYTPQKADVILYDWDDSGKGDNTGNPDHVGIVATTPSGSTFKVIEGNKSDTVAYRSMSVNGKYIRGYITPDYAAAAGSSSSGTTSGTGTTSSGSGTKTSSDSDYTYTSKLDVDGEIGPNTVKRLQTFVGQKGKSNVDGFIDGQASSLKKYWTAITSKACKWTGGASACIKKWQSYLIGKGYSCGSNGADGKLGKNTALATQKFLIAKKYSCGSDGADGKIGANSAKALQNFLNDNR